MSLMQFREEIMELSKETLQEMQEQIEWIKLERGLNKNIKPTELLLSNYTSKEEAEKLLGCELELLRQYPGSTLWRIL